MKTFVIETGAQNINKALTSFFRELMENNVIDALLVPQEVRSKSSVVMTLVKNPQSLDNVNPLAPVAMVNAARVVSSLTVTEPGQKIGVVLRSCETRALVELVKLQQANLDNLVIIGMDCMGTFEPMDYRHLVASGKWNLDNWLTAAAMGKTVYEDKDIRNACAMCGHIAAEHAQISIGWVGLNPTKELLIELDDELAEKVSGMNLKTTQGNSERLDVINRILSDKKNYTKNKDKEFKEITGDLLSLSDMLASCLRCYNCRQACPICFCQECVFVSPVFKHAPDDYLSWAQRKGVIEMPTDTLLFHITRINHMAQSCVGCGHCEIACPSKLPLTLFFRTAGKKVQDIFEYVPGRDLNEALPQTQYKENELEPR